MRYFLTLFIGLIINSSSLASQPELLGAISEENLTKAQELVRLGANPFKSNENGDSAVSVGLKTSEGSEVRQWAEALADESALKARVLRNLIEYNILTVAKFRAELEEASFYIDAILWDGETLLGHLCRLKGKEDYISVLLDFGADTEIAGPDERPPLFSAIHVGNARASDILISAGANLGALDDRGLTPLHFTADDWGYQSNDAKIARLLIKAGADINAATESEDTPLYYAILFDRPEIFEVLLDAGADPDIPSERGMTPLMQIVSQHTPSRLMMAEALIKAGANLDARNVSGRTALHTVALMDVLGGEGCCETYEEADAKVAQLIIDAGADINARDANGMTPLLFSIVEKHRRVTEVLLEAGADTNTPNHFGRTPLEIATLYRDKDLAKSIIMAGADITPEIWRRLSSQ